MSPRQANGGGARTRETVYERHSAKAQRLLRMSDASFSVSSVNAMSARPWSCARHGGHGAGRAGLCPVRACAWLPRVGVGWPGKVSTGAVAGVARGHVQRSQDTGANRVLQPLQQRDHLPYCLCFCPPPPPLVARAGAVQQVLWCTPRDPLRPCQNPSPHSFPSSREKNGGGRRGGLRGRVSRAREGRRACLRACVYVCVCVCVCVWN